MPVTSVRIRPLAGLPEFHPGDNLAQIIIGALDSAMKHDGLVADRAIFVVAQKVVSKAEGRIIRLESVEPSTRAIDWAERHQKDPRIIEVILGEAKRIVRMDRGILIVETSHGFVCANGGVDASNAPHGTVILLPVDPDASARRLRKELERTLRIQVAVIVSDTFGRPWRQGLTNVALGVAGLPPIIDYRGKSDSYGRPLQATMLAAADEIASAAELVMGKTQGIPVAIVEGYEYPEGYGSGHDLIRPADEDLFR